MATVVGTPANQTVTFGPGRDVFVPSPEGGHDTIVDFTSGEDRVWFPTFRPLGNPLRHAITDEAGIITLDLAAADGDEPGSHTLTFINATGLVRGDFAVGFRYDDPVPDPDPDTVLTPYEPGTRIVAGPFDPVLDSGIADERGDPVPIDPEYPDSLPLVDYYAIDSLSYIG